MKKQTLFIGTLVLALLFLNLHTYMTKNKIVDESYAIKDHAYSDKFGALNVFQDYAAQIKFILDKNQLSSDDLKYLNDFADSH